MSDTKNPTQSGTKSETTTALKSAETKSAEPKPAEAKTSDSVSAPSNKGDGGKSARESVGGAEVGHYGYFSNIKTPEYKSGWDDIWGEKKSDDIKKKVATKRKAAPKSTAPREVSLDFETLPVDLQVALASEARKQLKKSRINYDHRDKAGAVSWRIDCRVERPG
ncbi:MAG: hypothetical protein CMM16_01700 [Rhodospirillaceae bacterium]|nr:hypothetical protein [Rhodospirillaceae bacterium]